MSGKNPHSGDERMWMPSVMDGSKKADMTNYVAYDQDDIDEDDTSGESPRIQEDFDPMAEYRVPRIIDRENEYQSRRRKLVISPARHDPFAPGEKTPEITSERRTYAQIMTEQEQKKYRRALLEQMKTKAQEGTLNSSTSVAAAGHQVSKKRRWDQAVDEGQKSKISYGEAATPSNAKWDETPGRSRGGETPGATPAGSQRFWDVTPGHATPGAETPGRSSQSVPSVRKNRWDETPKTDRETPGHGAGWAETPRTDRTGDDFAKEAPTPVAKKRSRWDETPALSTPSMTPSIQPVGGTTPVCFTPGGATPTAFAPLAATPMGARAMAMATPAPGHTVGMTPEQMQVWSLQREFDERNRTLTDEEIDVLLPAGFKILQPPAGYVPITPLRKLSSTPTPIAASQRGFKMQTPGAKVQMVDLQPKGDLPTMHEADMQYFGELLNEVDENDLTPDELKVRRLKELLYKIKSGTPPMRKAALRQITNKAREFGPKILFDQVLHLLMMPHLEDQERHLLVKVVDRIIYKLDDLVRPYTHKILIVIEPQLIDEARLTRCEAQEIISNLTKAAGLATMISCMRPDIDNMDEYVRNASAKAFAVVANAVGIPSLLPFLKAVCKSKKSWQARHTGIKIVREIALLVGCAVLPCLKGLVDCIAHGLEDEQQKVRTISALAIGALAESATPYGIESFDSVLKPLWVGIRKHRGKGLAAFLRAIGYIIPLMDAEFSNYYTREVMLILIREFSSPDEEMKRNVLLVLKNCCATDGVEASYIKTDILPHYFKSFWNQRTALDRRNKTVVIDTTVSIATKVGASEILGRIVEGLKDESEQFRIMTMDVIYKVMTDLGAADIDSRLEELIVDGIIYSFQEQTTDDNVVLNCFSTVANALGKRVKPFIPQICGTIMWRMSNKIAKVRQQTADLTARIANVMMMCQEEKLTCHIGQMLYESLGEEYPDVLASILGGLKSIVNVVGMKRMNPSVKDLLPRLTPILKNRHELVQQNCIELIGRIADRGAEIVSAREWMRICFELLELLKAHKKGIRRAAVNTFGYIAKAIGPHDVLSTLLNNLKVQERQNRVCTTVAIAIVAETCSPFTVLPALMNEYRVPEMNVQNGVLKSLSFLFEYIGEMGKDYVYAVTPLLEDALMDRDLVHRQTAMSAIGHMALGLRGFGCEDALLHLMNYLWPNVFETSLHVAQAFMFAVEGMAFALGPRKVFQYLMQGLFHPARKVRHVYWKVFNTLYIGGGDALIPAYPRISNDEKNKYMRYELDYAL